MKKGAMLDALGVAERLGCAYTPRMARGAVEAMLLLDQRLGLVIARRGEAMLAQIKLAWWRERLAEGAGGAAARDPLLQMIAEHWHGQMAALAPLVDGWEHLLADAPLPSCAAQAFAAGRAEAWQAFAVLLGTDDDREAIGRAGHRWALADLASHSAEPEERAMALGLAAAEGTARVRLSRSLRALSVLDGLARRSVRRGGGALVDGRRALLYAMRLGMMG